MHIKVFVGFLLRQVFVKGLKIQALIETISNTRDEDACRSCLIKDGMLSRLLYFPTDELESQRIKRYWTYERPPIIHNLPNHCQKHYCKVNIKIEKQLSYFDLERESGTSLSDIARSHRICFVYRDDGLCSQCLARNVPDWKMMYSTFVIIQDEVYLSSVFFISNTESLDPKKLSRCQKYFCNNRLILLEIKQCEKITSYHHYSLFVNDRHTIRTISSVKQADSRSAVRQNAEVHSSYEDLTDTVNEIQASLNVIAVAEDFYQKLLNSLHFNDKLKFWSCVHANYTHRAMLPCEKCISEAAGGLKIIFRALSTTETYILLLHKQPADNILLQTLQVCVDKCDHIQIIATMTGKCREMSEKLYEFPEEKETAIQKNSICYRAEFVHSSKSSCSNSLNLMCEIISKGGEEVLCRRDLINPFDYESEVRKIMSLSRYTKHKCLITIYADTVCNGPKIVATWENLNITADRVKEISYINLDKAPDGLWPPCRDTPLNAITTLLHRQYAPVRFKDTTAVPGDCLSCIAASFEVFYISPTKDFIWMTQTTKLIMAKCEEAGCVFVTNGSHCTRDAPSSRPLYISSKINTKKRKREEDEDNFESIIGENTA